MFRASDLYSVTNITFISLHEHSVHQTYIQCPVKYVVTLRIDYFLSPSCHSCVLLIRFTP